MDIMESLQRIELLTTINGFLGFLDEYSQLLNMENSDTIKNDLVLTNEEILKRKLKHLKNKKILLEKEHVFLKKHCDVKNSKINWLKEIVVNRLIKINKIPIPLSDSHNVPDNLKCPSCFINKCNSILNCTHVVCSECSGKLEICPICDENIFKFGIVYFRI